MMRGRPSAVAERQRAEEDAMASRLGGVQDVLTSRGGPSPERTAGETVRRVETPVRVYTPPQGEKLGAGGEVVPLVNIWNTTNIGQNFGASVDNDGVTITVSAPTQVYFGWDGASAAGRTHRLIMTTGDVTGSFTIVGRVNTGNIIVGTTVIGPSVQVDIPVPIAGGETGWSFRSVSITTGRFECVLYDIT